MTYREVPTKYVMYLNHVDFRKVSEQLNIPAFYKLTQEDVRLGASMSQILSSTTTTTTTSVPLGDVPDTQENGDLGSFLNGKHLVTN